MKTSEDRALRDEFERGARAAAELAGHYDGSSTHEYRLEDCVLGKLNIRRGRPRRNERRLQPPKDAWICGFAAALSEIHRQLLGGFGESEIRAVARACNLTLASAKAAGASSFDQKELKRAGVARGTKGRRGSTP
jgi:hypothetical protein